MSVSPYDIFFAFGKPGTYVLSHPWGLIKRNLPDGLNGRLAQLPPKKTFALALDANQNYYGVWECINGSRFWFASSTFSTDYPGVVNYMRGRDSTKVFAVFGSQIGQYFSFCERSYAAWPKTGPLERVEQGWLGKVDIRVAALGLGDACVFIFSNGSYVFYSLNMYPDLYRFLSQPGMAQGDVVFVALNPYQKNEFFAVLKNGTVYFKASAVCRQDMLQILHQYPQLQVSSSQVARPDGQISTTAAIPQGERKDGLAGQLANNAVNAFVGAATPIAMSAVLTACTVM